jgi:hypothetical protein
VQLGRKVALMVCANCHVVAPDQPSKPILTPPAQSFETIAQDERVTVESVEKFLTTTHRGLDEPQGMPNPETDRAASESRNRLSSQLEESEVARDLPIT